MMKALFQSILGLIAFICTAVVGILLAPFALFGARHDIHRSINKHLAAKDLEQVLREQERDADLMAEFYERGDVSLEELRAEQAANDAQD